MGRILSYKPDVSSNPGSANFHLIFFSISVFKLSSMILKLSSCSGVLYLEPLSLLGSLEYSSNGAENQIILISFPMNTL